MHNLIHYKEHYGRISYSSNDNNFTSSVKGVKAGKNVSVKGSSEEEVKKAFKDYIDEMSNKSNTFKSLKLINGAGGVLWLPMIFSSHSISCHVLCL